MANHIVTERTNPGDSIDINKLIESVRERKDCSVHIFMTDSTTTINITPHECGDDPHWVPDGPSFRCSKCGWRSDLQHPYCSYCGELLKHSRFVELKALGDEKNDQI